MIERSAKLNMMAAITSLCKKIIFLFAAVLLTSCISVDLEPQVSAQPDFVTATLAPTKAGATPATLLPGPEVTSETPVVSTFTITALSVCKDAAILLRDVTIPDNTQVKAGGKFIKTWEFQNTGTCPWINYILKFSAGDELNAPLSAPMPAAAPFTAAIVGFSSLNSGNSHHVSGSSILRRVFFGF